MIFRTIISPFISNLHITRTASARLLVWVHNDTLDIVDSQGANMLVFLDLSHAFDTLHTKTLISKTVQTLIKHTRSTHMWLKSYLTDKHKSVLVIPQNRDCHMAFCREPCWVLCCSQQYTIPLSNFVSCNRLIRPSPI